MCPTCRPAMSSASSVAAAIVPVQADGLQGIGDRGERVAQLVGEHRQELVLAPVGRRELLGAPPQLLLQSPAVRDVGGDAEAALDDAAPRRGSDRR